MSLLYLFYFIGLFSANGQSCIEIDDTFKESNLHGYLSFFSDSTQKNTVQNLQLHVGLFKPCLEKNPNFGFNTKRHWLKFIVKNNGLTTQSLILKLDFPHYDELQFYVFEGDIPLYSVPFSSWRISAANRPIPYYLHAFPITLLPKQTQSIYLSIKREMGVVKVPIRLIPKKVFSEELVSDTLQIGLILGFLLLSITLSFLFFLRLKNNVFLYYCLFIIGAVLFFSSESGFLSYWFLGISDLFAGGYSYLIGLCFLIIFDISFTNELLEGNKNFPFWFLSISKGIQIFIGLLLSIFIFQVNVHQIVFYIGAFSFIFYFLGVIYFAFKSHSSTAVPILVSKIPYGIYNFFLVLSVMNIIPEFSFFYDTQSFPILFDILIMGLSMSYTFFEYKNQNEQLKLKQIESVIQTQETERRRIAQDLHDDLGGTLSVLKGIIGNESAESEVIKVIDKAIGDLRAISRNLLPPELASIGLNQAVRNLVVSMESASKINFTFVSFGEEIRFEENIELNIFRIVSELLNNVLKHSKATKATIQLVYHKSHLFVSVEDNGVGIETDKNLWGIGLKNINSRVELLKAKLIVDSNPTGSTFILEIPY